MSGYDQPCHDFSCRCSDCNEPEPDRDSPYARHVKEADQRREDAAMGICLACGKYYRGIHLEKWMCRCDFPRGVAPYCYDHNMKEPCFLCKQREGA